MLKAKVKEIDWQLKDAGIKLGDEGVVYFHGTCLSIRFGGRRSIAVGELLGRKLFHFEWVAR